MRALMPAQEGGTAAELLGRAMSPPHFPITPEQLRGSWSFDYLEAGAHESGGFRVLALEIPHKGGRTFGYRITDGLHTIAYLSDHNPFALGPGPSGFGAYHEAAMALARGADVLIHDAQYTAAEFPERHSWGHSAIDYPIGLGEAADVGRVVLFHHDPRRSDVELDLIAASVHSATVKISIAREGEWLRLPRRELRSPPAGAKIVSA